VSDLAASVRILVAQPQSASELPDIGTLEALRRLGGRVRIDVVYEPADCLARVRGGGVDLVVLDDGLGPGAEPILGALRDGPPVVVVTRGTAAEVALLAFRRGAADCVTASADYAEVLPAVALEQIRLWRDAHERRAAGRRIRSLERLHAAIVKEFPAALAVLDRAGRIVTVNPAFARAFGGGEEGARGALLAEVLPAELMGRARVAELLARADVGETPPPRVARTRVRDGSSRAFDVRAERLDEEGWLLLVLADVTERERLTKRVRDLQSYAENILQHMNSALVVVDPSGGVTAGNPAAERILGARPGALPGCSVWDWFPTTPRGEVLIGRTLQEGVRFRGAEAVLTRADGTWIPIGISCAPLLDADGTPLGAVAIFQDLSEIKQLQRQVLQAEKMASIGQLAAGVAHEINNPMGFVHANLFQMEEYLADLRRLWSALGRLQKAVAGRDLAEIRAASEHLEALSREVDAEYLLADFAKAIRESQEGAERIRHIVQDLRAFSHQGTGECVLTDVNQCLDSTAHIVSTMMKHSIVLRKEYEELPRIRGYPMQLKQVFMNLLVNAYQAIEERIRRDGGSGEVVLRSARVGDGVVVSVADDGVGVPAEHAERIFEPFFTTKEVGVGMGLGLSTSYNIVSRHGGKVRAERRTGGGALFEVFLPLDGQPEAAPEPGS
jgi:PAS domain S-box-containing protein